MTATDPMTSVPVHASTLRLLREFKTGSQNWDAFLLELLERELDRQDLEFAQKVLNEYHGRNVVASRPPARRGLRSPRRK